MTEAEKANSNKVIDCLFKRYCKKHFINKWKKYSERQINENMLQLSHNDLFIINMKKEEDKKEFNLLSSTSQMEFTLINNKKNERKEAIQVIEHIVLSITSNKKQIVELVQETPINESYEVIKINTKKIKKIKKPKMTQTEKATGNKIIGILLRRLNKKKHFNKWKNNKDNQYLLYTINNNEVFINGIREKKELAGILLSIDSNEICINSEKKDIIPLLPLTSVTLQIVGTLNNKN